MTSMSAIDPVCGMQVETVVAAVVEHDGQAFYFCESACAETFREDPERWIPSESIATG